MFLCTCVCKRHMPHSQLQHRVDRVYLSCTGNLQQLDQYRETQSPPADLCRHPPPVTSQPTLITPMGSLTHHARPSSLRCRIPLMGSEGTSPLTAYTRSLPTPPSGSLHPFHPFRCQGRVSVKSPCGLTFRFPAHWLLFSYLPPAYSISLFNQLHTICFPPPPAAKQPQRTSEKCVSL